jgi:hypothetical protein
MSNLPWRPALVFQSELLVGWILLWHYLHRRRRPAPVATTSAASLSSRKNVVMALSGGGRGPTHGWDLRWCENPVCDVRQVAATPPRRGRRLGEGRRAPEAGRREAEMALRVVPAREKDVAVPRQHGEPRLRTMSSDCRESCVVAATRRRRAAPGKRRGVD